MAAPGELKAAIDQMSREFNPAKAKGVNAVVQLNATGEGGGQYAVALADEKANFTEGAAENPNVTIEVKADDWVKIMSGEMDPTMAFMMGKLKITGDLGLMMRFQQIFWKVEFLTWLNGMDTLKSKSCPSRSAM